MSKRIALAFVAVVFLSAGLLFVRPPQARAVYATAPIILLHGFEMHSSQDCDKSDMWGTVKNYFQSHGMSNVFSLGFYTGDYDCGHYVSSWDSRCSSWYDSGVNNGTVNEDIRHTTCVIAWWIWDHSAQGATAVGVVAHSMGGILIRQVMNDTPYIAQFPPFLRVYDVATAGTPHQGLVSGAAGLWSLTGFFGGCSSPCLEVNQMEKANPLMSNMNCTCFRSGFARNPQGRDGTDWTTMASNYDELLGNGCTSQNELRNGPIQVYGTTRCGLMPGAKHFVVYDTTNPLYGHGGYLTDIRTTWDANETYSDDNGGTWFNVGNSEHSIFTMHFAMLYSSW